jgi:hypothetical protein
MAQLIKEQAPRTKTVGITLPNKIWDAIDKKRGDVPTSKYFLRLAEKDLGLTPIMTAVKAGYFGNEEQGK